MALYQSIAFFSAFNKGWSESWIHDSGSSTDVRALAQFDTFNIQGIWRKRQVFLGKEAILTDTRTNFLDQKSEAWPETPNFVGNANFPCAYPTLACLTRFAGADAVKWKNVWFRGIHDDAEQKGGIAQFDLPLGGFWGAVDAFAQFLIDNSWGFMSLRATPALLKIGKGYGVSLTDDKFINIYAAPGSFPNDQFKTYQVVNLKKVNDPAKSRLNGRQTVYVTGEVDNDNNQIIRIARPLAVFPWNGNEFQIQRFTPTFVPVKVFSKRKIASRDVGRPFGSPVGRHRVNAKG